MIHRPERGRAAGAARGGVAAWTLAALTVAGLSGPVPAAAQDSGDGTLRGLVIGIDAYAHVPPLGGAVNDAEAIAGALRSLGVQDLTVMVNQQVTRDGVTRAWDDLIARSRPGDVLVFTYAGHGSQEPERVPGSEEDHMDENFLLTGFDVSPPNNRERLVDDDIGDMLRKAEGRTVVFVADSCHSGTVTRAFDPRAATHRTRFTNVGPIEDDMLPPPPGGGAPPPEAPGESDAVAGEDSLSHVLFVAGVDEDKEVPEVTIGDQPHGALSYSVAHALMGEADRDGDGRVTVTEFQHFLRQGVRVYTDGRQSIRLDVGADVPVTRVLAKVGGGGGGAVTAPAAVSLPTRPESVALYVMDDGGGGMAQVLAGQAPVTLVNDPSDADLVWDVGGGAIVSALGDVVATLPAGAPNQQAVAAARVATKWALISTLKAWPESKRLIVDLAPDNGLHRVGDRVTLTVVGHTLPYLTLFNLDPFGGLNRVFPIPEMGDTLDAYADGRSVTLSTDVFPPVGGDHFVALATEHPPQALYDALASLDGRPVDARGLLTVLRQAVSGQRHEMGLHGVFTAR